MKIFINILILCLLIFSTAITKIYGQCAPNSLSFVGGEPIFNSACGNNSWQNLNGTTPSGSTLTYSWEVSFFGGAYTTIVNASNVPITTSNLAQKDITDFILVPNSNASGDYRIRRIVTDASSGCTNVSEPAFLYYSDNLGSISGGIITGENPICLGSSGTLTLQGHTGPILKWQSAPTSTGTWTDIANTTYQYSYSNLTSSTCFRALVDNICGGTIGSIDINDKYSETFCVTVLNGTAGLWTGLVSTDWFDCLNWDGGLPSSTIDAQIPTTPSGGSRMPVINRDSPLASLYSFIASSRDLIISPSASVTMVSTSNSELQVSRDWKNSGAFIPGTGTVTFNGATLNQIQTINAGIKTNETFYNLTTNNSGGALGISVEDKFELTVSNILSLLSGDIRLTGEAQLVQAGIGINPNPIGGTGNILIDQQGHKNSFIYNNWSSPVSADNFTYSVGGVLRDGTLMTNTFTDVSNFSPGSITFGDGAYFADTSNSGAIKISNRWIWTYNSTTPNTNTDWQNYYQWNYVGSSVAINVGDGFCMKGSGGAAAIDALQNYVFIGKPNSGDIMTSYLNEDQTYLIGNPFPSALDANEFIRNNIKDCTGCTGSANVFDGTLYFWDHFGLSNNHLLAQYEAGYAIYNLMGGVSAKSDVPLTASTGNLGSKVPERYIPVGQGFFVNAFDTGNLYFKNGQRVFQREVVTGTNSGSLFMKTVMSKKSKTQENQETTTDMRPKIRLIFDSPLGYRRPLLVGLDEYASNQFDIGYDGPLNEDGKEDMFWIIDNGKFVIQGVNNFDLEQVLPLGFKISETGLASIKIEALENIEEGVELFIKDHLTGETYKINSQPFEVILEAGEYLERFSLVFQPSLKTLQEVALENSIFIYMNNKISELQINKIVNTEITGVTLFNYLGLTMKTWKTGLNRRIISLPLKLATGVYIVQINTINGTINKRIIIE
ncbi:T9SS type A sorting domain-containing protein [Lutibacter maritimus]|uniref:Por secretion system C-terminal sorting domain-containing protein n=1 Tax=Lutibacter maritimus TaxID=593133 RepID=A0A1I6RFF4_9FLAO|nr:T9SS type A sorting domain-containing protein [Lutibacter maritimus]SFS63432.1 Por secretion system C-terminal sorting domain-containing protein [Lutibacter maritimus]